MNVIATRLPGVLLLEPQVLADHRGYYLQVWNRDRYAEAGIVAEFVQDNISFSHRHVLRGLHYQQPTAQGKLISVLQGTVWDVAADLRTDSPAFRQWVGAELSAENARQLYVPKGFAHGFVVLSETALVAYKCSAPYQPAHEHSIRWNDPDLRIEWPVTEPTLSPRDAAAPFIRDLPATVLFTIADAAGG